MFFRLEQVGTALVCLTYLFSLLFVDNVTALQQRVDKLHGLIDVYEITHNGKLAKTNAKLTHALGGANKSRLSQILEVPDFELSKVSDNGSASENESVAHTVMTTPLAKPSRVTGF